MTDREIDRKCDEIIAELRAAADYIDQLEAENARLASWVKKKPTQSITEHHDND